MALKYCEHSWLKIPWYQESLLSSKGDCTRHQFFCLFFFLHFSQYKQVKTLPNLKQYIRHTKACTDSRDSSYKEIKATLNRFKYPPGHQVTNHTQNLSLHYHLISLSLNKLFSNQEKSWLPWLHIVWGEWKKQQQKKHQQLKWVSGWFQRKTLKEESQADDDADASLSFPQTSIITLSVCAERFVNKIPISEGGVCGG